MGTDSACGLTVQRALPVQRPPTPIPSDSHDTHSSAPPRRAVAGPQTVHPTLPLWALVRPPTAASIREHPAHVGSPVLPPGQEWTEFTCMRGQREGTDYGVGFLYPKCTGSLAHRAASDFVQPPQASSACVCRVRVRVSVNSSRNMHFGTRRVTSHPSFALRPCFHLT